MVGSELDTAVHTIVRLAGLTGETFAANDFAHGESINSVIVVLGDRIAYGGEAAGQRRTAMIALASIINFGRTVNCV